MKRSVKVNETKTRADQRVYFWKEFDFKNILLGRLITKKKKERKYFKLSKTKLFKRIKFNPLMRLLR